MGRDEKKTREEGREGGGEGGGKREICLDPLNTKP